MQRDEKQLFDITTRLLKETIDPLARREKVTPADMAVMMVIILGRIAGKMGYRYMDGEKYWQEISTHGKSFFLLGFDSERQSDN